jgi:hypothetical protein
MRDRQKEKRPFSWNISNDVSLIFFQTTNLPLVAIPLKGCPKDLYLLINLNENFLTKAKHM